MIYTKEMALSEATANKNLWATPPHIFDPLNEEFKFTLDPCCTIETAKCEKFYTPAEDGLTKSWSNHTVFVNPPYERGTIDKWVYKCYLEGMGLNTTVAALLPVSTSSQWWHKWVKNNAQVRFYEGRIKFLGAPYTAPFSSVLCIWNRNHKPTPFLKPDNELRLHARK